MKIPGKNIKRIEKVRKKQIKNVYFIFLNQQLPTTNYQLPTTNYQLPTINYKL